MEENKQKTLQKNKKIEQVMGYELTFEVIFYRYVQRMMICKQKRFVAIKQSLIKLKLIFKKYTKKNKRKCMRKK